MIRIAPDITLDEREFEERFIRASGPGGQNVNKVSSAVQLRFDAGHCASLPGAVRQRLLALAGRRMTQEGVLVIEAQRFRDQARNRADARERLIELIRRAARKPKRRIPTRPSASSRERRLESKQRRGAIKRARSAKLD